MKKKFRTHNNNLNTDLYALLKNLPENILFHQEHNLRHPLGIYNVSVLRVMSGFEGVINTINSQNDFSGLTKEKNQRLQDLESQLIVEKDLTEKDVVNSKITEIKSELESISISVNAESKMILDSVKELLDSLMSFIDGTYNIMKCLYPANSVKKNIPFADKWLLECVEKKLISDFKDKIKEYRDILAPIVNKVKHNNASLNLIKFKTEHGLIHGYYVEGFDSKGSLGSDREIHKLFKNQETAFSINRDLKFHLANFYFICHHLKVTLERIIKGKHNIEIDISHYIITESEDYLKITKLVKNLPNLFFPDEVFKPIPVINTNELDIEVIFPANDVTLLLYGDTEISFSSTGDGVTKSFRLPYWTPRK